MSGQHKHTGAHRLPVNRRRRANLVMIILITVVVALVIALAVNVTIHDGISSFIIWKDTR